MLTPNSCSFVSCPVFQVYHRLGGSYLDYIKGDNPSVQECLHQLGVQAKEERGRIRKHSISFDH